MPGRPRILFVSPYPRDRAPSQRFRFEQYVDFLAEHGFTTTFSPILRGDEYELMYRRGAVARKGAILARGVLQRLGEARAGGRFDIVIVHREAIQLGTAVFERLLARGPAKLIYDFDDAIWIRDTSPANRRFDWLKRPQKTAQIIARADMVFAGNAYLATYARRFNPEVRVVPTTIDTGVYDARPAVRPDGRVCIGWTGSPTTLKHFELAVPALRRVRERFGDRVYFKLIGDEAYRHDELGIRGRPWRAETAVQDLAELDVGLMPLPDDEWSEGKCGFKGLQYMALRIPTIMSPVGVNTEIISDGQNGYLADSVEDWVARIGELVESPERRRELGEAARRTVVQRYSVDSQQAAYLGHLHDVLRR
jgi:glycosyltransferase involved in cell wall biosynthesis